MCVLRIIVRGKISFDPDIIIFSKKEIIIMLIRDIDTKELNSIRHLISLETYEKLKASKSFALAAFEDKNKPYVGALTYKKLVYGESNNEILIESVFVDEAYRKMGVCSLLTGALESKIISDGAFDGISINIPLPELSGVASIYASFGYVHRADGNQIFTLPKASVLNTPIMEQLSNMKTKYAVLSFENTPLADLNEFYKKFEGTFPEWLNPNFYGGILQKDASFLLLGNNGNPEAFISCSLLSDGQLYLGGIYVHKNEGLKVAALLSALARRLEKRKDIVSITFSAATKDSLRLADRIINECDKTPYRQVVSNYYKDLSGQ